MQLHRVEPNLHTVRLRMFGNSAIGWKQGELQVAMGLLIEGFNVTTPSFVLAVVDLAEIQHLALHHLVPSHL